MSAIETAAAPVSAEAPAARVPWGERAPWLVLAAAAVLYFWALGARPLYAPDEGRYALIGREMLESGDWLVPTLAGVPYLDKPPLLYWMEAASMAVFGKNEFGVRFPIAATALLGVWLLYLLAKDMYGHPRAVIASACLAFAGMYFLIARILLTDLLLSVAILGAFLGFWRAWRGKSGAVGMWIALALAFLAKGPVGPALFVFGAAPFWWLARPRPRLRAFRPVLGPALWLALALPWTILIQRRVPEYLEWFYWHENIKGLGSSHVHHPHGAWYAFASVASGFLPWTLLLPFALWRGVRRLFGRSDVAVAGATANCEAPRGTRVQRILRCPAALWRDLRAAAATGWNGDPGLGLALFWAGTTMGVFTISVSKLGTYYVPMYPALALLVARIYTLPGEPRRFPAGMFAFVAAATPVAALIAPHFHRLVPAFGGLFYASLVAAVAAAVASRLFSLGRAVGAFQAVAVGLALGIIPASFDVANFDNVRSSRNILLRNAGLLRSCEVVLSDRSPIGFPEWYLGLPVTYIGDPHDFTSGKDLAPDAGRFIDLKDLPQFLKAHPRAALLTPIRKRDDMAHDYPGFRERDLDEGNLLLTSPEVQ